MRKLIYILFIGSSVGMNAQTGSNPSPVNYNIDMYPKTPEAAALSKFVDIPAGNYTGVADFTIPLYTIELDGQKIPIELRYTTTGITVGQIATRVGLGWTLNTGPSLSQQVVGVQDTTFPRPILQNGLQPFPSNDTPGSDYDIAMRASGLRRNGSNPVDIKPDIFTYSLLNDNGKFILNADGTKGVPMPYNQVSIIPSDYFARMNIADEKGFKYIFNKAYDDLKTKNTCAELTVDPEFDFFDPNFKIYKIISTKNKEVKYLYNYSISAKYVNSIMTQERISLSKPSNPPPGPQPYEGFINKCANYTLSKDSPLTEIQFDGGKVLFIYSNQNTNPRLDVSGDVFLTNVIVKNDKDQVIKNYTMSYDYFDSPEPIPSATGIFTNKAEYLLGMNKRLKLISVQDNLTMGNYSFEYFESYLGKTLPYRISNNQDYWGVYNGANNGEKAISLSRYESVNVQSAYLGADKKPNIEYGKLGNLKKIIYPTGGYSEVNYEADEYDISENPIIIYDYNTDYFSHLVNDNTNPPTKATFTITNNSQNKEIIFTGNPSTINQIGACSWNLKKPTGTIEKGTSSGVLPRNDIAGNYEFWIERDENYPTVKCVAKYGFTDVIKTPIDSIFVQKTGSIRVSKIESFDNNNGKITRQYTYKVPTQNHILPYPKTSGVNQGEEMFMSLSTQKYPLGSQHGMVMELIASNNPGWQTASVRGKAVGYSFVQEYYIDHNTPANSYRKEYQFKNEREPQYHDPSSAINVTWKNSGLDRGLLLEEQLFDSAGKPVRKTENEYQYDGYFNNKYSPNSPFGPESMGYGLEIIPTKSFGSPGTGTSYTFENATFVLNNYWIRQKKSTTTEYTPVGDSLQIEKTNFYSPDYKHTYPKETFTTGSMAETLKTNFQYPQDITAASSQYGMMQSLILKNEISDPVVTQTLTDNTVTSEIRTIYDEFASSTGTMTLPKSIYLKKGENAAEEDRKITYNSYDSKGNITQYTMENGTPVSVIWGYNKTQPIVKVEGAIFDNIKSHALITAAITAADNDYFSVQGQTPAETEQSLITTLDNLHKGVDFKDFLLTTYTYDPLVGVQTVTPPSGIREYYFYDSSGRLQSVKIKEKDASGIEVFRIIKENEYHYKQP